MLYRLSSIWSGGISLRKIIRIFILNVAIFPKTFKSLLIARCELILSNFSRSLSRKSKFCFFIGVLNAVIHICSCSLPLNEWILDWIRTLWNYSVVFRNFNIHFILHFQFASNIIKFFSIIIILCIIALFDPIILILIFLNNICLIFT